jgi:hypothetical protein
LSKWQHKNVNKKGAIDEDFQVPWMGSRIELVGDVERCGARYDTTRRECRGVA